MSVGNQPATPGDFLGICINLGGDIWTLAEVTEVNEVGIAIVVELAGEERPVHHLADGSSRRHRVIGDGLSNREAVRSLCGRVFFGVEALASAINPHRDVARYEALMTERSA